MSSDTTTTAQLALYVSHLQQHLTLGTASRNTSSASECILQATWRASSCDATARDRSVPHAEPRDIFDLLEYHRPAD
jgi:hypothetical protein